MFQTSSPESRLGAAIYLSERIYHASVRKVRQKHGNALLSILVTIGQTALFTLAFYIMFAILPIRAAGIRGDFFIYTMSGVFLFMAHIQTVKAISASEKSTSAMMQHAPMTPLGLSSTSPPTTRPAPRWTASTDTLATALGARLSAPMPYYRRINSG